jgi:hypothetical protein
MRTSIVLILLIGAALLLAGDRADRVSATFEPSRALAAGDDHTCLLRDTGNVRCWGRGDEGQLGSGVAGSSDVPVIVSNLTTGAASDAGDGSSCTLLGDGTVRCWGRNVEGQLGNGDNSPASAPVTVTGLSGAIDVAVGGQHACGALNTGGVVCWGAGSEGQLGNGATSNSNVPVAVTGITTATGVAAGAAHSCALLSSGSVSCWGRNDHGQLGTGSAGGQSDTPVAVTGLIDAVSIAAGGNQTCAVRTNATAQCWGQNDEGQLGDNAGGTDSPFPVTVAGPANVGSVAMHAHHACAVHTDGTAWCWGRGIEGQLGSGDNTSVDTPIQVDGLDEAVAIAVGELHSCAALDDGRAFCWGSNALGQLGDDSGIGSNVPVAVASDPWNGGFVANSMQPGCVVSPSPPAPSTEVLCITETSGGQGDPGTVATASAPLPGGAQLMSVGETIRHDATFVPHTAGVYAVAVGPGTPHIDCMQGIAGLDQNGDLVPDLYFEQTAIFRGEGDGSGLELLVTSAVTPSSLEVPRNVSLAVSYVGNGLYDVVCTIDDVTLTGTVSVGTDVAQIGQVGNINLELYNAFGIPYTFAAAPANATFTDMRLYLLSPPPLIDPAGVVYEAGNPSVRIPGASVTLERFNGSTFVPMHPIADAGYYHPLDNPQFSGTDGSYRWDVAPGTYRVRVVKTGCTPATSSTVSIPPAVTDLDIPLTCADADGDGVKDWRETNSGVYLSAANTGGSPADADSDDDGASDGVEMAAGSNPVDPDTDDDTINDGPDNCVLVANTSQVNGDRNFVDLTPPKANDDLTWPNSDAMGDACDSDDDNDGIADAAETAGAPCAAASAATEPLLRDSDGDRALDGPECALNTDPNDPGSRPALADCASAGDTDADGLSDRIEACYYNTLTNNTNTDGDGCGDAREAVSMDTNLTVNSADLGLTASAFGTYGTPPAPGHEWRMNMDVDKNGTVNSADLGLVASRFGACP